MGGTAPGTERKPELRPSKGAILSRDFSACGPERVRIALLSGVACSGAMVREVWVEPLTGKNEMWTERVGVDLSLPEWVTRLIDSNVLTEGKIPAEDLASMMSVADRDAIILSLRMLTFGPEIWGVARCPQEGCASMMDFNFDLTSLKLTEARDLSPFYPVSVCYGGEDFELNCREPDGADQEAIYSIIRHSPYAALLELLSRCIVSFNGRSDITPEMLRALPEGLIFEIERSIADRMASFDWGVGLECPECGKGFSSNLDIQAYFWQELMFLREDFWREIHMLAFYYHWSENDILSLTRWRRKMYLNRIENHLASRAY